MKLPSQPEQEKIDGEIPRMIILSIEGEPDLEHKIIILKDVERPKKMEQEMENKELGSKKNQNKTKLVRK
ncbi:hypothetical protein TSAR_008253 [Trichomalopsis sarcophagae]|uniref:Uncharacterized protein n=1 Tax=Trichomalopsis sarcophagae TaxID=543379 RepID=A0A232EDR8_9HYME|nr:hypothetical protein TSAR_008253 [Trichomalopsis sarcophagae]